MYADDTYRSVISYRAKVWGHEYFEDIEKLQRYFLDSQGTYQIIYNLETALNTLFIYNTHLHLLIYCFGY